MKYSGWVWVLSLAGAAWLPGCIEPLADRCYLESDCDEGQVCSNDGDRSMQGYCVLPEEEDAGTDFEDAGFDAGDTDAGDTDAGDTDAGDTDAGDTDAGSDAAVDGGADDAGADANVDGGSDAG